VIRKSTNEKKVLKCIKTHALLVKNSHSTRMSTSWEYWDVSPARYPSPGRKRKSGSAKNTYPVGKKKNETLVIQNMTPVELRKMR